MAGAGPVGLCLAIDLGRRGVRTLLLDRNTAPAHWPKMDRTNARSMELFRRIGLAERIRQLGFPADVPMDVFLTRSMAEPPLAVLQFPSVAQWRERISACHDGSLPLEPYQLVAQNRLEPMLKEVAEGTPNVTVRYDCEVTDFEQDDDQVTARTASSEGRAHSFSASYLAGCDGGVSTIRKRCGIALQGQGNIRELRQVVFYSPDLFDKLNYGRGRHYSFLDAHGSLIVIQGDRKEFTLHTDLPEDTDFEPVIAGLVGFPCEIRVLHVASWRHNLLLAERYRDRRVFLAGDSAHLVIPTGGLGMNTGLGDAFDLAWKLAGRVRGWGGEGLLAAYEAERRPVGAFNVAAAGWAAEGVPLWRALCRPEALQDTEEGADLRHEIAKSFTVNHGRMHAMRGAESAYSYAGSPIIADGAATTEEWDRDRYVAHTRPGFRIPHMWLRSGTALQDMMGMEYSLLCFGATDRAAALAELFRARGIELKLVALDEPHMRDLYDRDFYLVRPDLHIAWSGDEIPADAAALVDIITGRA